jgi:alkanesulfonate monooxygenase SsuD/methylene tetrahydromethanopterin reductase-like flavin-dependent oxidoreductase (luciferase family)
VRFDSGVIVHVGDVSTYPPVAEWGDTARFLESAGFTGVWCAEHHFFWDGWLAPTPTNPLMFGAYIASQTTTLRLGQCGVCLPDWHPLRVAEDVATLDHLSGGRVDFGVMRGLNNRVAGNFNGDADRRDQKRLQELFWESLEIIQMAWSGEPFRYDGRFYKLPFAGWKDESAPPDQLDPRFYAPDGELTALQVIPKPLQEPAPPCWVMAETASSTTTAAARGLGVLSWAQSFNATRAALGAYREAAPPAAAERFGIMRPVYVARTMDEAERVMRPAINLEMEHVMGGVSSTWRGRQAFLGPDEELTDADRSSDWFDFLNRHEWCFVGTPDHVAERLLKFEQELGCRHVVFYWALPLLSYEQIMGSMKLFADEVMPRFAAERAEPATAAVAATPGAVRNAES